MKWIIAITIVVLMTSSVSNAQFAIFQVVKPTAETNFLLDGIGGFLLDGTSGKLIAQ